MDFIILDLEWNQCPGGKKKENPALPFEIIEIGAVRLDEDLKVRDTFHEIISPVVYHHLHRRTRDVISLRDKDLSGHRNFPDVARDFFHWCGTQYGKDYIFCTWGPADLPQLQQNLKFFRNAGSIKNPFPFPLTYLDVQKLFTMAYEGKKGSRSLEYAVDFLKIEKKDDFHDALHDAVYTAEVMKYIPEQMLKIWVSVDYFHTPRNKEEEIFLSFPTYTKYVSRPFPDKESALKDKTVASSICPVCGRRCRRKIRWFSSGSKNMLSLAVCPDHGFLKGKLRLRSGQNGQIYVIKTLKNIDELQAAEIYDKKIAAKRRKKKKSI